MLKSSCRESGSNVLQPEGCGPIGDCVGCGLGLPLRLAGPGEKASVWVCTRCGARYNTVLDESQNCGTFENVRPAALSFEHTHLVRPPEAIDTFIRLLMQRENPESDERRQAERHKVVTHVTAVSLDETFRPIGEPFIATTRDISKTGLAILHTRAVPSKLLVVELPSPSGAAMQVLVRVVRCQTLGRFYEIAGPFVTRLAP